MAMDPFDAIFTNVLSETKSINDIFLPYFQCPIFGMSLPLGNH